MKNKLVNKNTFNLKSTITDDWGGSHRIELDIEALSSAKDWKIGIDLPQGYTIDQSYGALVTQENGKAYISGANIPDEMWNKKLNQGDKAKVVLIVLEGENSNLDPIAPKFFFAESANKTTVNTVESKPSFDIDSQVTNDWQGGYKVELDLTAESQAKNWQLDFNLPYEVSAAYGVDLVKKGNGKYTISGQNDQASLNKGQSIKPVLIIEDNGQDALVPEFIQSKPIAKPVVAKPQAAAPTPEETEVSEPIASPAPKPAAAKLGVSTSIAEDWNGGYKVELGLTAEAKSNNWKLDFNLPYEVSAAYGADIENKGNGNYTISGQNDQVNLEKGQSIKPVLIIEDNGQQALVPRI